MMWVRGCQWAWLRLLGECFPWASTCWLVPRRPVVKVGPTSKYDDTICRRAKPRIQEIHVYRGQWFHKEGTKYWERLVSSVGTEIIGRCVLGHARLLMSLCVSERCPCHHQGVSRFLGDPPDPIGEFLRPLSLGKKGF